MSKSAFIASGAALFGCFYVVQWWVYRPRIEHDLALRTAKVLHDHSFQVTRLQFNGRDAEIQIAAPGSHSHAATEAAAVANGVFGVRVARVIAQATQSKTPSLRVERTGENVRLKGLLPTSSLQALFQEAAERAFPQMQIRNETQVDAAVEELQYLSPLRAMLPLLAQTAPEGTLELQGVRVRLSGSVPSISAKADLETKAKQLVPHGLELEADIRAPEYRKEIESARLHFKFNSVELTEDTLYQVEPLIEMLKEQAEPRLRILGHADSIGTAAYNHKLSLRRSRAVEKLFRQQGITRRIETKGLGKSQPIADNATEAGRASNRRVQLEILGGS